MNNLRETRLENVDESVIRGYEVTVFVFRERHIEAVIYADFGSRCNIVCPWNERLVRKESRCR